MTLETKENLTSDESFGDNDFFVPERYDVDLTKTGVWFEAIDEHDVSWGKFKLTWYDKSNPSVKKALDAARTKHAKAIRLGKADTDAIILETFIGAALLDWKVNNKKGKPVAYNPKNVADYFAIPQVKEFLLEKLIEFAGDVRNFKKVDKDDLLGN